MMADPPLQMGTHVTKSGISPESDVYIDKEFAELNLVQLMQNVKIATAIALIRLKPNDVTGEEYAMHLADKITHDLGLGSARCHDFNAFFDTMEKYISQEKLSNTGLASQTSLENNSSNTSTCTETQLSTSSCDTVQFMRGILTFNSLTANENTPIISQTVCNSIETHLVNVLNHLRSDFGLKMPSTVVTKAVDSIHNLFKIEHDLLIEKVKNICSSFVKDLVSDIMETEDVCLNSVQMSRCLLIQIICRCPSLRFHILLQLSCIVINFHNSLLTLSTSQDNHSVVKIENIVYVLHSLECILDLALEHRNSGLSECENVPEDFAQRWCIAVQNSTDFVGTTYSLVSLYMTQLYHKVQKMIYL